MEVVGEEGPALLQQLESARRKVSELEAIGDAAREEIPGFEGVLDAAREKRDQLQRERKASRPVHWRLVEAQRQAKTKAEALDKSQKKLDHLRQEHDKIQANIATQETELVKAQLALTEADSAVAAIYQEFAAETKPAADGTLKATVAAAEGLAKQVDALPAALQSSNAEAAVIAIQKQIFSLLANLRDDTSGVGEAVNTGDIGTPSYDAKVSQRARPNGSLRSSGRRGTSPSVGHDSDAFSDAVCRSRSRERLTAAEQAAAASSRRLDDMGFNVKATSDAYVDVAGASSSMQQRG